MKQIFVVKVQRDDTVRVVAADVKKETPQFFFIEQPREWNHPDHAAFGYSNRIYKENAHTTARAALEHYMTRRQRAKEDAKAVVAQATKQIASANELLVHLQEDRS